MVNRSTGSKIRLRRARSLDVPRSLWVTTPQLVAPPQFIRSVILSDRRERRISTFTASSALERDSSALRLRMTK